MNDLMFSGTALYDFYKNYEKAQYRCLVAFCLLEFFVLAIGNETCNFLPYYLAENFLIFPAVAFFVLYLMKPCVLFENRAFASRRLLFCIASVAWFLLLQLYHRFCGETTYSFSLYVCGMLMAFPFAAATRGKIQQRGFRVVGNTYLAGVTVVCFFSLLLKLDILPEGLALSYYWDCARLNASWHSNLAAALILIGFGLAISRIFQQNGWKRRAAYGVLAAVFFYFLSLTDCRTSVWAACLLLAGVAALAVARKDWKFILLAVLVFGLLLVGSYKLSSLLFDFHADSLADTYQKQLAAGIAPTTVKAGNTLSIQVQYLTSDERSWDNDGTTLNGRTQIWAAAIRALRENPKILLLGRQDVGATVTYYSGTPDDYPFPVDHTHNSWLEVLFRTGIVGLASALYITWIAVKNGFKLVFSSADMSKKCIAVLVAALLMCGFMEPFLFSGDTEFHFLNIFFLFTVGYLELWANERTVSK